VVSSLKIFSYKFYVGKFSRQNEILCQWVKQEDTIYHQNFMHLRNAVGPAFHNVRFTSHSVSESVMQPIHCVIMVKVRKSFQMSKCQERRSIFSHSLMRVPMEFPHC
jgi:hypothetical protein